MNPRQLLRFERGLSAGKVASEAGIAPKTLRAFEQGTTTIGAPTAKAIADVYGITVAELLGVDTDAQAA